MKELKLRIAACMFLILCMVCSTLVLERIERKKVEEQMRVNAERSAYLERMAQAEKTTQKLTGLVTDQLEYTGKQVDDLRLKLKDAWAANMLTTEKKEEFITTASGVRKMVDEDGNTIVDYNGEKIKIRPADKEHLTQFSGVYYYGEQKETYYNLDMSVVVQVAKSSGIKGDYSVREDGCKMLGEFIMVAADYGVHPYGSVVETSLGTGIVVDTGGFAAWNPYQVDIAVSW